MHPWRICCRSALEAPEHVGQKSACMTAVAFIESASSDLLERSYVGELRPCQNGHIVFSYAKDLPKSGADPLRRSPRRVRPGKAEAPRRPTD